MSFENLNTGIIYTTDNCIGCNKCISGCIAVGANVVMKDAELGSYRVYVDPDKCILCGSCVEECVHGARTYRDDTDDFFDALERGENITILVAPTLLTDYEKRYHNILGYLKHMGVRHIYNTSFGGDLMVWVYMNFIHNFGLAGVISQICPVIVHYLEKYRPELLDFLMPVQSPMMCTAIYVKDYLKNDDKLAYISPCIASKYEIQDVNTYARVTYNVTFERLMKRIEQIDISQYYANDEVSYGLGALISMSGGLSDNIERYIGFNEVLIQTAGPMHIFPYFDHYYKEVRHNGELPFLVDALSCTNGCNFGTGTRCGVELRNEMTFSAHRVKESAYQSGNVETAFNHKERLNLLNKRFAEFEMSSFVRQYGRTRRITTQILSEEQIEEIFLSMYKYTFEQRNTDCGACGYAKCRDMAYAIGMNINHKENCINYSKECIRLETEKTNRLLVEISKMNEELMHATQMKSNFLANMSHEIRTPMNAIIGMAEMAMRGELPSEERGYIQQIKASGRSLLAIINDILDFSKIESGKMELNETEYNVMSLINDTVNIVLTRIGEKDITLVIKADPQIPCALVGDDIRIKQILVNFANNAVKFTESGCVEIKLSCECEEDTAYLTVAVRDTGIGIKKEDLDKLFNSFQQVDSKRNRNVEGTGLGLAISREFVRLMHGEISVDSVYGEGSTFSFRIPQKIIRRSPSVVIKGDKTVKLASMIVNGHVMDGYLTAVNDLGLQNIDCKNVQDMESAVEAGATFFFVNYPCWTEDVDAFAHSHPELQVVILVDPRKELVFAPYVRKINQPAYCLNIAAIINNEPIDFFEHDLHEQEFRFEAPEAQILIVDDNAINLTVAKGLLTPLRMNISTALSAREAIAMLQEQKFDIVFMDHMMPDIDGIEATHMIRENDDIYYKKLPIIALTANAINNAKEMFLREGMNDFVAKPVEMVDITSKLRKWLPPEKIKTVGTMEQQTTEKEQKEDLVIEGLDVEAGLALSGSMELYKSVLSDYHAAIEKKAALIEKYAEDQDIEAYTIEVHAIKSASKLIGAMELSALAAKLEKCGHDRQLEPILQETDTLLQMYRAYIPILQPYARVCEVKEKVLMSQQEVEQLLQEIAEKLDDFDIDGAKGVMDQLRCCETQGECVDLQARLETAVEEMEYDEAAELAEEWLELCQTETAVQ